MAHEKEIGLTAIPEADVEEYRAVSPVAIFGLLLGLLGVTAVLAPVMWLLPLAGAVLCLVALWQIAGSPELIGRKAAMVGLVLSLVWLAGAPAEWVTRRYLLRNEAQQFAQLWFAFLRAREPHKALELNNSPEGRQSPNDLLWLNYQANPNTYGRLDRFANDQPVRGLLDLGERCQVRYYDTTRQWVENDMDHVEQFYAVTYDRGEGPTTFFVKLILQRVIPKNTRQSYWRVMYQEGGLPEGVQATPS